MVFFFQEGLPIDIFVNHVFSGQEFLEGEVGKLDFVAAHAVEQTAARFDFIK